MSEVADNASEHRYELVEDGQTAFAEYRRNGETIVFTHTIVPSALEGRGIGTRLVTFALDDARARGLSVVPQCSFVAGYIDRHPDYRDLVA